MSDSSKKSGVKSPSKKTMKEAHSGVTNFSVYIKRILKQSHPDLGLNKNALMELNSYANYISSDFARKSAEIARSAGKRTISTREVQSSVQVMLTNELARHAISEAKKALENFSKNIKQKGSLSAKAGIVMTVSRMRKFLGAHSLRVSKGSPIYLAAVVEYLCAEILELSGNSARDDKRMRITARDILKAVQHDDELSNFFSVNGLQILGGGVLPNIHTAILPERHNPDLDGKKPGDLDEDGNVITEAKIKMNNKLKKQRVNPNYLRDIRHAQKQSNCTMFPSLPFKRLVKEIMQEYDKEAYKLEEAALRTLQFHVEQYLVEFLSEANLMAIHAGRQRLEPKDLALTRRVRTESYFI